MALATILSEAPAVWAADVLELGAGTFAPTDERHKHKVCCSFVAAGDWVELYYENGQGTRSLWGDRFTAAAEHANAAVLDGATGGVVVFEFHSLTPGLWLRRSGVNVVLVAHDVQDDRRVGGAPP